jgi:hypothetical protein
LSRIDYSEMNDGKLVFIRDLIHLQAEAANWTFSYFRDFKSMVKDYGSPFWFYSGSDGFSSEKSGIAGSWWTTTFFLGVVFVDNLAGDFFPSFDGDVLPLSLSYGVFVGVCFPF